MKNEEDWFQQNKNNQTLTLFKQKLNLKYFFSFIHKFVDVVENRSFCIKIFFAINRRFKFETFEVIFTENRYIHDFATGLSQSTKKSDLRSGQRSKDSPTTEFT